VTRSKPGDRLDAIERILEELGSRGPRTVVLVEGDRDLMALRTLKVPEPMEKINTGVSLLNFCEGLANEFEAFVILTDWDPKGEQLANRLGELLTSTGTRVDLETRKRLGRLVRFEIQDVEALDSHIQRLRVAAGVESRRSRRDGAFSDCPGNGAGDG
jgi:5S rRNA maturation endonuclease (ribonuclease M5)